MKLAEALLLRADLNARIAQVRERTLRIAQIQEGETPAEDPTELLPDHERLVAQLEETIARINRTNLAVTLPSGRTMTEALARRDALKLRIEYLRAVGAAATVAPKRITRSELRTVATVNVRDLLREADRLAHEFRDGESEIQAANWTSNLL